MKKSPSFGQIAMLSVLGRCPKCYRGSLFQGYSRPSKKCPDCGLSFAYENIGDAPSAFLLILIGCPAVFVVAYFYLRYDWVFWQLLAVFALVVVVGMALLLRPLKAMFMIIQYITKSL